MQGVQDQRTSIWRAEEPLALGSILGVCHKVPKQWLFDWVRAAQDPGCAALRLPLFRYEFGLSCRLGSWKPEAGVVLRESGGKVIHASLLFLSEHSQ